QPDGVFLALCAVPVHRIARGEHSYALREDAGGRGGGVRGSAQGDLQATLALAQVDRHLRYDLTFVARNARPFALLRSSCVTSFLECRTKVSWATGGCVK